MIIRPSQTAALASSQRECFENRLNQFMKDRYPRYTAGMSASELGKFVHESVDKAMRHRITQEDDVALFCSIRLTIETDGRNDTGWFDPIAANRDLTTREKLRRMQREVLARCESGPKFDVAGQC